MARTQQQLAEESRDAGFRSRVESAICATGMSIANNGSSSAPRVALARASVANAFNTAAQWALPVRVSGSNIGLDTLTDAQVTAGVEGVFTALAGS